MNELEAHLGDVYGATTTKRVSLGNLAEGLGDKKPQVPRSVLNLSVVNVKEEKALKNIPNVVRNNTNFTAQYQNQPVYLNVQVLVTATHEGYDDAVLALSRAIRFFQYKNVFTQDNVRPESLSSNIPALDQFESFKLILDLYSASMEEINHLWGTLGGKQYPFVLYMLRMLELQFKAVQSETGLITEITTDFYHKTPVTKS